MVDSAKKYQKGLYSLCVCALSRAQLFATVALWTVAHEAPLSMEFSRQE